MSPRRDDPLSTVNTRQTPQTQRADARQVRNNAGGYVFATSDVERLRRFLTLGTTGGTYYVSQQNLTTDNAQLVLDMARSQPELVVNEVVRISTGGLAPRQQPGLFALAAVASHADVDGRRLALERLRDVARTGTTLFQFIQYAENMRGWGPTLRRAVQRWYLAPPVERVAFQAVKYRQREGWTHRDVLRLSHPKPRKDDVERRALFDWICGRRDDFTDLTDVPTSENDPLRIVEGYERVQRTNSAAEAVGIIRTYRLPWEALPDQLMNDASIWNALLDNGLPQTALIRQLPRLTRIGVLTARGNQTRNVVKQLTNPELLQRGRIHPVNVLTAQRTYTQGYSYRGSTSWAPVRPIIDALDQAFYAAYGAVAPTGKRLCLALDVSGSMTSRIGDMPVSAREASAALALVTANVEDDYEILGFTARSRTSGGRQPRSWLDVQRNTGVSPLTISPRQRLDDAVRAVSSLPFGYTDCALPITHALNNNLEFDAFIVYTDNESYAGPVHVHQALRRYRERTGIAARLIVVAMTATRFSVADPNDPLSLDVAGFDASTPSVISNFVTG